MNLKLKNIRTKNLIDIALKYEKFESNYQGHITIFIESNCYITCNYYENVNGDIHLSIPNYRKICVEFDISNENNQHHKIDNEIIIDTYKKMRNYFIRKLIELEVIKI